MIFFHLTKKQKLFEREKKLRNRNAQHLFFFVSLNLLVCHILHPPILSTTISFLPNFDCPSYLKIFYN